MSFLGLALPFTFSQPAWLWLLLLIPVLVIASLRSLAGLDKARRVLALTVRSLVVLFVACCLARIERVRHNDDLTVIYLMDRSHSVEPMERFQEDYVRESAAKMPPKDRLGLIDFSRGAFLEQMPMTGGYFLQPGRLSIMRDTDRTNIAGALRLAMALFDHKTAKRIVLMSDGNDNTGDPLAEARRARADGIPIDVVPLSYRHRNEVFVERMLAPSHAEPGEQVPIRIVFQSQRRTTGTLTLFHNGRLVEVPEEEARVTLNPGVTTFYLKLSVDNPGAHTFEAVFRPDDPTMDASPRNNRGTAFTFVAGTGDVLLVTADPQQDAVLADALRSENVKLAVKTTAELGEFNLLEMMNYAAIILSNVPATAFTEDQQKELTVYVKDMGSGLIMLGGDEGFGAGGWIGSPVEEVMPVSFEIKHKRVIPRGALVLILHSCEMPRGTIYGKEMAKKSVDTISSQDYIGVLAYTYSPGGENWEVPLDLNTNKAAVKAKIDRTSIGDMPDFGATLQMAYKELTSGRGRDAAQKHVIIFSDGDPQGPPGSLLAKYRNAKITISTIGIGWGRHVMAKELQRIANATKGRFYAARNPRQLPQIFVKESKVVRRPLIVDEPFQPQVLHAYSDLLAGIDASTALPPLGGMVMTSPKQSPNVIIPMIRATDDGEDPVLVHWQYELGKTVAFASGWWPHWGANWTAWPKFAKLWAQIVRWCMRQDAPANFDTYTKIDGNRAWVVIDALDKDASYLNLLQLRAGVVGPDSDAVPLEFQQTGPGHYEAEVPIEKAGQYLANVRVFDGAGKSLGTIRTGLSIPFSPEYRDLEPNFGLLRQIQETSGGRWLDMAGSEADVFSHDLPPSEAKRPAWDWVLAWLLLPMFLLDVAVRRLASWLALSIAVEVVVLVFLLFGVELAYGPALGILLAFLIADAIGWAIRFRYIGPLFEFVTHTVTALGHTGDRSEVALEKLKTTRDQLREDRAAETGGDGQAPGGDDQPIPLAVAKRRYDAGDQGEAVPVGDISETLGGATADEGKPGAIRPKPAARTGEQAEEQSTTSRLLRSKRQTRPKDEDT